MIPLAVGFSLQPLDLDLYLLFCVGKLLELFVEPRLEADRFRQLLPAEDVAKLAAVSVTNILALSKTGLIHL